MKLESFNLERAMAGDKVVTRSGKDVVAFFPNPKKANIHTQMLFVYKDSQDIFFSDYTNLNGIYDPTGRSECNKDLFMVSVAKLCNCDATFLREQKNNESIHLFVKACIHIWDTGLSIQAGSAVHLHLEELINKIENF